MKFNPKGGRVVVERAKPDEKTVGGLFIPKVAQDKLNRGIILAIGDGGKLGYKVGDVVLFAKYGGTEMELDGKDIVILDEREIFGTFEA